MRRAARAGGGAPAPTRVGAVVLSGVELYSGEDRWASAAWLGSGRRTSGEPRPTPAPGQRLSAPVPPPAGASACPRKAGAFFCGCVGQAVLPIPPSRPGPLLRRRRGRTIREALHARSEVL